MIDSNTYEHTITFRLDKPSKPLWERLGYKTEKEYWDSMHFLYKNHSGEMACYTCKDKPCPCLKQNG